MYAVLRIGGRQFKVSPGERLRVPRLAGEAGALVTLGEVLALHDGETLRLGAPLLESAGVRARVVGQGRGRKIVVYRFERRKGYHRKKGHRQDFTEVVIEEIAPGA